MNFIKVGSACPVTKVADVDFNVENINLCIDEAYDKEVKYLVFPELAVTSYTCGDLFLNSALLNASINGMKNIVEHSLYKDMLITIGAPHLHNNILYNCAYMIFNGKILGIVPKSYILTIVNFMKKMVY